jgi:uncharacterized membrane protein
MEVNMLIAIIVILILVAIIGFEICCLKMVPKTEPKPEIRKLTEKEKQKQEELRKNFQELMDYDYEKALKRK